MSRILQILLFLLYTKSIIASAGDREYEYQLCIQTRYVADCSLSTILRLTGWSCLDDLKYRCMQEISSKKLERGLEILQYHGKWPFIRVLGMQEPASVLFSLGNMYAHFRGIKSLQKFNGHWKNLYLTFGYISILVWTASTIFHARDFPITEKLDYFMAILGLEYSFYISFLKAWSLFNSRITERILIVYYMWHVLYLSIGRFDYSYNMIIGIILGLLTNFHWLLWYYKRGYKTNYGWKQVVFTVGISFAMSLEVLDFPPILGFIDAHSLWHLSTIPLVFLHYSFLYDDLLEDLDVNAHRKRSL